MDKKNILIIDSIAESHFQKANIEQSILDGMEVSLVHVESDEELDDTLLNDVDALILWACVPSVNITKTVLDKLTSCKVIVKAAVGYDNIALCAAADNAISVYNTPDYGSEEVADHTMAMLLACLRRLKKADKHVQESGWDWKSVGPISRLRGMKLGIIGFGRIGGAVAKRAQAFGLNITFYDPYISSGVEKSYGIHRSETLDELLASADIISVNCSLNNSSEHLLAQEEFKKMKDGVVIINTARGGVIQTQALLDAIENDIVSTAGLDVLEGEPNIPPAFRGKDNILLSPHSAFYSQAAFLEMREKSAIMVKRALNKETIRNKVN